MWIQTPVLVSHRFVTQQFHSMNHQGSLPMYSHHLLVYLVEWTSSFTISQSGTSSPAGRGCRTCIQQSQWLTRNKTNDDGQLALLWQLITLNLGSLRCWITTGLLLQQRPSINQTIHTAEKQKEKPREEIKSPDMLCKSKQIIYLWNWKWWPLVVQWQAQVSLSLFWNEPSTPTSQNNSALLSRAGALQSPDQVIHTSHLRGQGSASLEFHR